MSVHSLEGAADVARVVLVWLDAQEPESAAVPESWATWQEVPAGVMYRARSGVGTWVNNGGIRLATIDWEPSTYTEARMRCLAPFVRADG
jgi:hypothetical protein